ncbi:MAG: hypothetical protein JRN06_02435 [Nitrososphaerota archaeon]|nr:hypothetical protein [Nitrososphaerota archaeon]MDG7023286.1 hypothetical protein [Nitrososphaerota archaeon]
MANIVMEIVFVALGFLGVMQFAWLPTVGDLFGGPGLESDAALYGLGEYVLLGIVFGLIFAFAFNSHSVMKGMGIAGIGFALVAVALTSVSTAEFNGTILSLPLTSALLFLVSLAIGFAVWGATLGYVGKKYNL